MGYRRMAAPSVEPVCPIGAELGLTAGQEGVSWARTRAVHCPQQERSLDDGTQR